MNFQLISDIHGKLHRIEIDKNTDILLVAGDVSENIDITLNVLSKLPYPSFYILGNHEPYGKDYYETYERIRDFCEKSKNNVIFLDNQTVEIDNYRIIGSSLWTNFENLDPFILESTWNALNDYRKIETKSINIDEKNMIDKLHERHLRNIEHILMNGSNLEKNKLQTFIEKRKNVFNENNIHDFFTPYFSYIQNNKNKLWLENELKDDFSGKTVVMTHHAPSYTPLILGKYLVSPFEDFISKYVSRRNIPHKIGGYCNSLENLAIKYNIDTWVHGHFHEFLNYRLGNASVYCNAMGNNNNKEMGYRRFIFNCSEEEKQESLIYQLDIFINTCYELAYFLEIQLNEKRDILDINHLFILRSYWKEIEIILNNIHSLPVIIIPNSLINFYPDPLHKFSDINHDVELNTIDTISILKDMHENTEDLYFKLKSWIDDLMN